MHTSPRTFRPALFLISGLFTCILIGLSSPALSQNKGEKTFAATVTDNHGIETEIKNIQFYWEEKISETAFVPHELRHVPVKRGNATINIKLDGIKTIEMRSPGEKSLPAIAISLANGNSGEFTLAISGNFKGLSDFGETEIPATAVRKIVFK